MFDRVPEELKSSRNWVLWRTVVRDGKPTKQPFSINGTSASSTVASTWNTFNRVVEVWGKGGQDGIGYVFASGDPYCGIDLDGCRDPQTGIVSAWAREIILGFSSYAEVSPSGTGVKIWCLGKWPRAGMSIDLESETPVCSKSPGVEAYDQGRYFAVTGKALAGQTAIVECQSQIDALCKFMEAEREKQKRGNDKFTSEAAVIDRARKYVAKIPGAVSGRKGHNVTFHVACVLALGFSLGQDAALQVLGEWNQTCDPPWSVYDLTHKVESANDQPGERGYLRNVQPANWSSVRVPEYKSPLPKVQPRITTLKEAALSYLDSIRNGQDRLIDLSIPDLDYALAGGVEAGELILLAARPSHCKSAVALQMVHHWTLNGLPSLFISEEMSAVALGKRTVQFATDVPQEHWMDRMPEIDRHLAEHFEERANCQIVENIRTAEAAAEAIRMSVAEHGTRCVIVDYAQLLQSPGKSRYEQVSNTSVCLRQIANETRVVLVALCQLNRMVESRKRFIPQMSDLRESGQLEQDADVVMFCVWPHRIDANIDPVEFQFFVNKNRNRAINTQFVECRLEASRQMILDAKSIFGSDPFADEEPEYRPSAREVYQQISLEPEVKKIEAVETQTLRAPRDEGIAAAIAGEPRTANPYSDSDFAKRLLWSDGWDDAHTIGG